MPTLRDLITKQDIGRFTFVGPGTSGPNKNKSKNVTKPAKKQGNKKKK